MDEQVKMAEKPELKLQSIANLLEQLNRTLEILERISPREVANESDCIYSAAQRKVVETIAIVCTVNGYRWKSEPDGRPRHV